MSLKFIWIENFIQRYKNAKKIIEQIKRSEWIPDYNYISQEHLTADRDGLILWIGNGSFFCEIEKNKYNPLDQKYFGLFWRHYVWWSAARRLKKDADKKFNKLKDNKVPNTPIGVYIMSGFFLYIIISIISIVFFTYSFTD